MSRTGRAKKRLIQPDTIHNSRLVSRIINRVMKSGKKSVASKQVYQAMEIAGTKLKKDDLIEVMRQALENIKPIMEVRSRRVGGAAYQVPMPVKGDRREALAIRWLIACANKRSNKEFKTFSEKLAAELIDATHKEGLAIKKREEAHRSAEANKAFAHFRW
jgi:small subunit ribosomal protein S7